MSSFIGQIVAGGLDTVLLAYVKADSDYSNSVSAYGVVAAIERSPYDFVNATIHLKGWDFDVYIRKAPEGLLVSVEDNDGDLILEDVSLPEMRRQLRRLVDIQGAFRPTI